MTGWLLFALTLAGFVATGAAAVMAFVVQRRQRAAMQADWMAVNLLMMKTLDAEEQLTARLLEAYEAAFAEGAEEISREVEVRLWRSALIADDLRRVRERLESDVETVEQR